MASKKVYIVTGDNYPNGDAGAIRQHFFAKMCRKLGYEVTVIGYGACTDNEFCEYDGVSYTSLRPSSESKLTRLFMRMSAKHRYMHVIGKLGVPDALLVADPGLPTVKALARYAAKHGCILIHDSVEWYSPESFKFGKYSPAYVMNERMNTKVIRSPWRVIGISSFLTEHFKSRGVFSVRIPVIMDTVEIPATYHPERTEQDKIRIAYAGSPGKKDYLHEIIRGMLLLEDAERERLEFHIVGIRKEQLISNCGLTEEEVTAANAFVTAHGRVSHDEAVSFVRSADFTVLIRDASHRYAKAGFPTKVPESLCNGTPVICNDSSDLAMYLKDGENAIIAEGHTAADVAVAMRRLLAKSREELAEMRVNARATAEEFFDLQKYISQISNILSKID